MANQEESPTEAEILKRIDSDRDQVLNRIENKLDAIIEWIISSSLSMKLFNMDKDGWKIFQR